MSSATSKKSKSSKPASEARDYFKEEDKFYICQIRVVSPKAPGAKEEGDEDPDKAAVQEVCAAKIKQNIKKDGGNSKLNYNMNTFEFS